MLGFFQRVSPDQKDFEATIAATAAMVRDPAAQALAARKKLTVVDLTWEDTARFKFSCVGPNISDLTIQVHHDKKASGATCMPVIRAPNFSDRTADLPLEEIFLRVGNEHGRDLETVSLRDYLADLRRYLTRPSSWAGDQRSLLTPRDRHALVSAQACFLPVPRAGMAQFNPVLFNYQSRAGAPAVLTLVVTREGTSATIIDNTRDLITAGYARGQRLFFNQAGHRASFTGQRESDFREEQQAQGQSAEAAGPNLNLAMLIQIPLVQPEPPPVKFSDMPVPCCAAPCAPRARFAMGVSDVEAAVLGHGDIEGPFTELKDLPIERDPRFPIRVTVQYYKATSNGVVNAADLDEIKASIERTYSDARAIGSLVVDGLTSRLTESSTAAQPHIRPWWSRLFG